MILKRVMAIGVCVGVWPLLTWAQGTAAPGGGAFKSAEANAAVKEADAGEAKARAEYEKAMIGIRSKLIESLNAAKDKATKAGDLDEAVKLRDRIAELKAANVLSGAVTTLPGDWKVKAASKFQGTLRLRA